MRHKLWKFWLRLTLRTPCDHCDGHGAVERLDTGYMLRFGLRPWNGCRACGGQGEVRGSGIARAT